MTEPMPRLLIVGAGDLAGQVLYQLARDLRPVAVTLGGRRDAEVRGKVNLARLAALQVGRQPVVDGRRVDLDDVDATAETIAALRPDVIFNTASLQSWWVIGTLPPAAFQRLYRANFGPWLPMHLTPALRLMTAVRRSGVRPVVVNAAYPDAVHPVLHTAGLAPDAGIGNVANNVPALRLIAAERLGVPVRDVGVRFVAHHYVSHHVSRTGDAEPDTFRLQVTVKGADRTADVDAGTLFLPLTSSHRRLGGMAGQLMTAASALSVLRPLLHGDAAQAHAPGVGGLPGGYPVRIGHGAVVLDLPASVGLGDAVAVNEAGQRRDGIDRIRPDGTVEFTEESAGIMRESLGYDCRTMRLADCADHALELGARYQEYAARSGQDRTAAPTAVG
ncbi:hypothetical protein [Dactylosporangium sp. NPDC050588]|uniref:hypothetical protein n=1 Tax=Dactylosporangium sp. NPDC050588 TaxID=3157211 RepID=UPI0033FC7093